MKALIPLILLAACGAQPSPVMIGANRQDVTRDGRQYTIYWTAQRFEVIRLGYAKNGEHQGIRQTMLDLVLQVTHCKLVPSTVTGDSGEMHGYISCLKAP